MTDYTISMGLRTTDRLDPDELAVYVARVREGDGQALADFRAIRGAVRERIHLDLAPQFEAISILHLHAVEALNWSSKTFAGLHDDGALDEAELMAFDVLGGLAVRGLKVMEEVAWLLEGGFKEGAAARARTLHELAITSMVLAKYGSPEGQHGDLYQRYLDHEGVFVPTVARDLVVAGGDAIAQTLDADVLEILTKRREALIEKYGTDFRAMWGWAAVLLPKRTPANMATVSDLVEPGLMALYGMASPEVHAGSQGLRDSYEFVDGIRHYVVGPVSHDSGYVRNLAVTFALSLLEMAVPAVIEAPDGKRVDSGAKFLGALDVYARAARADGSQGEPQEHQDQRDSSRSESPRGSNPHV
ncbi:DUF5677 domain-containing protein [Pseudoclavibacter sp. Z016]|uniref:DUF5677 domain-containing protein n=1 Tax=Pseudoclavibacter sp. Z016 TaxID=2080581 RepID=UPI000CE7A478|nr:DUF5677 domain-containing protein [Pseudoclavibacter sp. Z016]PPF76006.1 hypothetical protein C5B99_09095 [Pseudoclavibacter sp. Z016]